MRIVMPFIFVLVLVASVARFSGAARSADHPIWAKQSREITSNSLRDLENREDPLVCVGGGGGQDTPSDFKARLLRQRISELPDLRNIRRYTRLRDAEKKKRNFVRTYTSSLYE